MLVWIVCFATQALNFIMFFTKKSVDRFVNYLATVRNYIFKPVHLPNIPRNNFGDFQ